MRVLLSDGTGLTARQSAGRLSEAGHEVEVLSPEPLCLCRFTRHDRRQMLVKTPIGTASTGVCQVTTSGQLWRLAAQYEKDGIFAAGTAPCPRM
jgi:uncharacterized protein YbjT (DUF2867 family)